MRRLSGVAESVEGQFYFFLSSLETYDVQYILNKSENYALKESAQYYLFKGIS